MYTTMKQLHFTKKFALDKLVSLSVTKNNKRIRFASGESKNEDQTVQNILPEHMCFNKFLCKRFVEASKSLVVKAEDKHTCASINKFCSSVGKVSQMFHYEINSQHFILIEMNHPEEMIEVFKATNNKRNVTYSISPYECEFGFYFDNGTKMPIGKPIQNISYNCQLKAKNYKLVAKNSLQNETLSEKIIYMYNELKLNDLGIRLRFLMCKKILRMMRGIMSEASVFPFGSSVNGFGINGCDLDLVIVDSNKFREIVSKPIKTTERSLMQSQLQAIADVARFFLQDVSRVTFIKNARVPIVKFKHLFTDIDCDLSMYCNSGVKMTEILFILSGMDDCIKPLIFIIRVWAKNMAIIQAQPNDSITNFSLTLLVIFFLQQKCSGELLPCFDALNINGDTLLLEDNLKFILNHFQSQQKKEKYSLEQLLLLFFKFYSQFNFNKFGCCLTTGNFIEKVDNSSLYIKNPLSPELNVSRNVSFNSLTNFQDLTSVAVEILENKFQVYGKDSHMLLLNFLSSSLYTKILLHKNKSLDITKIFSRS